MVKHCEVELTRLKEGGQVRLFLNRPATDHVVQGKSDLMRGSLTL